MLSRFPSLFLVRAHNKHLPAVRPTALGGRAAQATQPAEASAGLWRRGQRCSVLRARSRGAALWRLRACGFGHLGCKHSIQPWPTETNEERLREVRSWSRYPGVQGVSQQGFTGHLSEFHSCMKELLAFLTLPCHFLVSHVQS